MSTTLISTSDLQARLSDQRLKIIDGSWHLDGRDAGADFARERIPGAVRFDLDAVSDSTSSLPHMLPGSLEFADAMGQLGVSEIDDIVVYDTAGLFSAARVWWSLRSMGARTVRVLDGGFPKWKDEGRPVDVGPAATPLPTAFTPSAQPAGVAGLEQVRNALTGAAQVLDARGAARFTGETPEPRPGLRSGHMPGAINLPYARLMSPDGTLLPAPALAEIFREAGVDIAQPIVTSCGSGVTAAILTLALAELGVESRLYDGSWAEWGSQDDTAVVTGA